ncbi:MAG: hypothetical protein ABR548_15560 [Actinomycetota bacterium]|nr:hypothetical protein [Actinomycetota bacterium]
MRELATAERINRFLHELGRASSAQSTLYLTGGATAVLVGWRDSTIDVDIKLVPETNELLRSIPRLKENLRVNVELASPDQFIPVKEGWESRSPFVMDTGCLTVRHFEFCAQAVGKLERAHTQDLADVEAMVERNLISREQIIDYFEAIRGFLYRFPAIDPRAFERSIRMFASRL